MEDNQNNFFSRLKYARKRTGLSRAFIAQKLGLSNPSQISRYESGKSFPSIEALDKIAEVLDIDLHWLLTGKTSPSALKAIHILKPFAQAHLAEITAKIQALRKEREELIAEGAYELPELEVFGEDPDREKEIAEKLSKQPALGSKDRPLQKFQASVRLKEIDDEVEGLEGYYEAIMKALSKVLESPDEKTK